MTRTWRVTVDTIVEERIDGEDIATTVAVVTAPTAQLALKQLVLTSTNVEAIACIHVERIVERVDD